MNRILKSICAFIGALAILAGATWGIGRAITGTWDVRDWGKPDIEQSDNSAGLGGGFLIEPNDSGAVAFTVSSTSDLVGNINNHEHSVACLVASNGCPYCKIKGCDICYPNGNSGSQIGSGGGLEINSHIHSLACNFNGNICEQCKAINCEICYPDGIGDLPIPATHTHSSFCTTIIGGCPECEAIGCLVCMSAANKNPIFTNHTHNDNCANGVKVCNACLEKGCEICQAENEARNNLSVIATVNPSYVTFKTLHLSIHWDSDEGYEDSDMYGEDVNDYVKLSKTIVESGEVFTVQRLKAFDCPIVLEADNHGGAKGSCAIHSVAPVESVTLDFGEYSDYHSYDIDGVLTYDGYDYQVLGDIGVAVKYGYGSKIDKIDFNHNVELRLSLFGGVVNDFAALVDNFDLTGCSESYDIVQFYADNLSDDLSDLNYKSVVSMYSSDVSWWEDFFLECFGVETDPDSEDFDGDKYNDFYEAFALYKNITVFTLTFSFFGEFSGWEYAYSFDVKFDPAGMIVGGDVNMGDVNFV